MLSTKSAANHSGSSSHLYVTPDELDRLLRTFAVMSFEMSTVARPSSVTCKLEAETVIGARVCFEDSGTKRWASSKSMVPAIGPVLVDPLHHVRLQRTCIMLVVEYIVNKRITPVNL
jgi:hypothetical protein